VLRLRFFHAALFGENKLRFAGFDQKPLYFNSSVAAKTLALRGCRKVALKENVAASRERFTVMTQVHSWTPAEPPPCAIMFRIQSVTGGRIRARLKVPGDWLLQFGPKGSYRTEHVLRFLDWWCKPVGRPADTIVVVLDWFKPHLDERVDEMLHDNGHSVLRIGGGITPDVQVGDTHRHGPYSRVYRDLEAEDAQIQLQLRPSQLPNCSRQTVMDRAYEAWRDVPHTDSEQEWVQNGITNALDGSQDGDLRSDLQSLWQALRMPVLRDQIRAEIADEVAAGRLHAWSQYPDLLEPYDEHAPLEEGWEDADREIGVEDNGDVDSPCDIEYDDTPREIREEEQAARDSDDAEDDHMKEPDASAAAIVSMEASVDPDASAAAIVSMEASVEETRVTDILTADAETQARNDLKQEIGGARLQALAEAAELLKKNGEVAAAEELENRLHGLLKKQTQLSNASRLYLRSKTLDRRQEAAAARAAAGENDRRLKELQTRLKIAKQETAAQRSVATVEKTVAKQKIKELQTETMKEKKNQQAQKDFEEQLRQRLAAYLVQTCKKYVNHPDHGAARRDAVLQRIAKYRKAKRQYKITEPPRPWPVSNRFGYIVATPVMCAADKKKQIESSLLWPWHGNYTMDVFLTRPSLQKRCVFDSIKFWTP